MPLYALVHLLLFCEEKQIDKTVNEQKTAEQKLQQPQK